MSGPFESYDDLDDVDERLQAADPGERRVAIIALGHSGDPAAVGHLSAMVADPDYQEITHLRTVGLEAAVLQATTPWG